MSARFLNSTKNEIYKNFIINYIQFFTSCQDNIMFMFVMNILKQIHALICLHLS